MFDSIEPPQSSGWQLRAVIAAMLLAVLASVSGVWQWRASSVAPTPAAILAPAHLVSKETVDRLSLPTPLAASSSHRIAAIPIRDIRVGMRVPAHNPQRSDAERAAQDLQIDPSSWRRFTLDVEKQDGSGTVQVELLRPSQWLVDEIDGTAASLVEWIEQQDPQARDDSRERPDWLHALGTAAYLLSEDAWHEIACETIAWADTLQPLLASGDPLSGLGSLVQRSIDQAVTDHHQRVDLNQSLIAEVQAGGGVGTELWLDLPELGAVGWATVVANDACPRIQSGQGQVVTATFVHQSAHVLDLVFSPTNRMSNDTRILPLSNDQTVQAFGRTRPTTRVSNSAVERPRGSELQLGVTAQHPFWSVTRDDFISAGELRLDEQVVAIDGQIWRLSSITPRAGPETVYNFEVAGEHVYYVGTDGLLVHNACTVFQDGVKIVGRSFQQAMVKAGRMIPHALINTGKRLHGYHIVMKGSFRHWLKGSRKHVKDAQKILKEAGIKIHDMRNMAHAINAQHSVAYAKAVADQLRKAKAMPGNLTKNVEEALNYMSSVLQKGNQFW